MRGGSEIGPNLLGSGRGSRENLAQTQFVQIDSLLTGSFHELPSNRRQPKITFMSRGQLNCLPKVEFRLQVEVGLGT